MSTDHAPYLAAVERAFLRAALEALNAHAEDRDPRGGAIQLDPHSPAFLTSAWADWDEVWVVWNEDAGWSLVCSQERDRGREPRRVAIDLKVPRLASPNAVVSAAVAMLGADVNVPAEFPSVDFPEHRFEDDDVEFEQALARYAKSGS